MTYERGRCFLRRIRHLRNLLNKLHRDKLGGAGESKANGDKDWNVVINEVREWLGPCASAIISISCALEPEPEHIAKATNYPPYAGVSPAVQALVFRWNSIGVLQNVDEVVWMGWPCCAHPTTFAGIQVVFDDAFRPTHHTPPSVLAAVIRVVVAARHDGRHRQARLVRWHQLSLIAHTVA